MFPLILTKKEQFLNHICFLATVQDGKGLVSTDDVQRVCDEFGLDVSRHTLEGLMEFCDVDSDGIVDFVEFSNYLTWKEKLPIKPREQQILLTGASSPDLWQCHSHC